MTLLTTLIVDDEPLARETMRNLVLADPDLSLVGEAENGKAGLAEIRRLKPALLLLDVQMPGLSGVEMLMRLAPAERPHTMFITAHNEYALKAFDLAAVDYLLKPYTDARFRTAVDRAKTKLRGSGFVELNRQFDTLVEQFQKHRAFGSGDHVIAVKAGGEIRVLKPDDIHWIEAQGDYLKFHTTGAHLISRETMQHFLARAPADRFLRVHKSTIVNVRAVRCIESIHAGDHRVRLCDGAEVRVSRLHRNQLHTLLGR